MSFDIVIIYIHEPTYSSNLEGKRYLSEIEKFLFPTILFH